MIIVTGDSIEDRYIYGSAQRLSPEAPVPIMGDIFEEVRDGGALNVFNNIQSSEKTFVIDKHYVKPVKTRIVCSGQQVIRLDKEIEQNCQPDIPKDSFLVISDYGKGSVSDPQKLIRESKYSIVDAKNNIARYHSASIIKCNMKEFLDETRLTKLTEDSLRHARHKFNCSTLIVTANEDGAYYYGASGFGHVEAIKKEVVDVTGAGDVFLALLATRIYQNSTLENAVRTAVKGATLSVSYRGTYTLSKEDYENCVH